LEKYIFIGDLLMEIHQIVPNIKMGDAIGNETLFIRDLLREWGHRSDIYAHDIQFGTGAIPYLKYQKISSKDNILIYHYSLNSEMLNFIKQLPDKIVLIYHNQTPEKYFRGVNEEIADAIHNGRSDLKDLAKVVTLGLGDSEYNRQELEKSGFPKTDVLPILLNFEKYSLNNEKIVKKYDDGWVNILFVGRIVPNKRQDELIKIFYYYKKINPHSRLFIIGSSQGFEEYYMRLKELITQLSLQDVIMPGSICDNDLNAYYSLADVFICMSEHEGFCVPLIECMQFNIPIIAYNVTAIPDTLGESGILVNKKNYCEIAELVDRIIHDNNLKQRLIEKQQERLKAFEFNKITTKLKLLLNEVMSN
jgi:L-malate glycosyltransferase